MLQARFSLITKPESPEWAHCVLSRRGYPVFSSRVISCAALGALNSGIRLGHAWVVLWGAQLNYLSPNVCETFSRRVHYFPTR